MRTLRSLILPLLLLAAPAAWAGSGDHAADRHRGEPAWKPAAADMFRHGNDPLSPWAGFADAAAGHPAVTDAATRTGCGENELARAIRLPVRLVEHYAATTLAFLAKLCAQAIFGLRED